MYSHREKITSYYVLIGVPLLIYSFFVLFPIIVSFILGFSTWRYHQFQSFAGLTNYLKIVQDPQFYWALWHNLQIALVSVFGQIPLALFLAYSIHRKMIKGGNFFVVMIFLPITISSVVVALLWNRVFSPVGIFTDLVRSVSSNPDYVVRISENKQLAMIPVLFVILWMHTSLYLVIFIANLQRIPNSFFEAAVMDGATEPYIFRKIVVPIFANTLFTCSILAIAGSLKSFDLIFAMTGGGPVDYTSVLATYMYDKSFTGGDLGLGSAISTVSALLSIFIILGLRHVYQAFARKYG